MFSQAQLPAVTHQTLSLTRLHDAYYWMNIETLPPQVASLDFRHWYFDDATFYKYAKKVANLPLLSIRIFDCPFGFERPNIPAGAFQRKLYERTKIITDLLHRFQPSTCRLSPFITNVPSAMHDDYLRFFVDHRACFNAYSLDTCYDLTDRSYGFLTSFLHQVLKVQPRPIWALWSIPSCDHAIQLNDLNGEEGNWKSVQQKAAVAKALQIFEATEKMSNGACNWFIFAGQDFYSPRKSPSDAFWHPEHFFHSHTRQDTWQPCHFTGLVDHEGNVKQSMLQVILDTWRKYAPSNK